MSAYILCHWEFYRAIKLIIENTKLGQNHNSQKKENTYSEREIDRGGGAWGSKQKHIIHPISDSCRFASSKLQQWAQNHFLFIQQQIHKIGKQWKNKYKKNQTARQHFIPVWK